MITDRTLWLPAGELVETVRTGTSPFERLFGMPFFQHFAQDTNTAANLPRQHGRLVRLGEPDHRAGV